MATSVDLVYKLDNINAEDGVDVFEIAPILLHFGELIRSANTVLGYEQKIDVRVRPFEEGSWITQFILQCQGTISSLFNYLSSPEGTQLISILALLGFNVKDGISGVAQIIRFTKGLVHNFKKEGEDTVTYYNDKGEVLTVSLEEHKLVQSPLIQNNYYGCVIAPLEKFPGTTGVTIMNKEGVVGQRFTHNDKPAFENYAKTDLFEELEDNVSTWSGVYVKPKRGSYSGLEQQYSFMSGETTLWPVMIEDKVFLENLRSGDIRLYSEDVLKVDMEVRQKKDLMNKVRANYVIVKVIEYHKYEKPRQLNIGDLGKDKKE